MKQKIRIGILMGGASREREVSFAGGRTVYDNLDKTIFEPIPIFLDAFNNMILLDWPYVYKGSIRDFFPTATYKSNDFKTHPLYSECLSLTKNEYNKLLNEIGEPINPSDLKEKCDFVFLALHGTMGEDGTIQGLLDWHKIPYSGSGIFASQWAMNKAKQREDMLRYGYKSPQFYAVQKDELQFKNLSEFKEKLHSELGNQFVIKPANQGSSLGVSIINQETTLNHFKKALEKAFFQQTILKSEWQNINQKAYIIELSDIKSNLGLPLWCEDTYIKTPTELVQQINTIFNHGVEEIVLKAAQTEHTVLIEEYIEGREFSCIVLNNNGTPFALPPTEILKHKNFFDYQAKYLPGKAHKITPMDINAKELTAISNACESLFTDFNFKTYARIDGFLTSNCTVFLNDPNTTSGMLPSSFFFHQASEIGLTPKHFLTYIIKTSLEERKSESFILNQHHQVYNRLLQLIQPLETTNSQKIRIGIILGGYSTERHISIESGRNIFEKLNASDQYEPIPFFLGKGMKLYQIPINYLLKDNADDIQSKIDLKQEKNQDSEKIRHKAQNILDLFQLNPKFTAEEIKFNELKLYVDEVFIALHGKPGENGEIQQELEKYGIPYNGSGVESSQLTINKFETNKKLRANGFLVANHLEISKIEGHIPEIFDEIEKALSYPLIAKPIDEGCSSAVKKINNKEELKAYFQLAFRKDSYLDKKSCELLNVLPSDEFPSKDSVLLESIISSNNADVFIEITGGVITENIDGKIKYKAFNPSESTAETGILSLEEKFLAGQGQNITPALFHTNQSINEQINNTVKSTLEKVAQLLNVSGYCRIDAFVRYYEQNNKTEVIIIELNSLPGMTPATCIYHQAALEDLKPYDFINKIMTFARNI